MKSYIDIHSHILPGIDDGAENFETSMQMLRIAQKQGIHSIILTPHYKPMHHNAHPESLAALRERLLEGMKREGLDIGLYLGNEFYFHSGMFQKLEEKQACTMAGSAYVLIEFGPMDSFGTIRNGLYEALSQGYRPILAHVERYGSVSSQRGRVEEMVQMGCYIQINAGSVMGKFGFAARQFTKRLLGDGLVHFVATDSHNAGNRSPQLAECEKYISRKFSGEYAKRLFWDNPLCVIRDEYI